MADNRDVEFFNSLFRSPINNVMDTLDRLMIIDIGIILEIDGKGRASIQTSKVIDAGPVIITNVEVIFPGNKAGAFTVDSVGSTCLLFAPRTVVHNVKAAEICPVLPSFSMSGIKALPISNGRGLNVEQTVESDGTISTVTDNYIVSFMKDGISYESLQGMYFYIMPDNSLSLHRKNSSSGMVDLKINDDGITGSYSTIENDSKYIFNTNNDGVLSLTHVGTDPDKKLNDISIQKDGTLNISSADNIILTISPDGTISVQTKGNISLESTGGTLSLSSKGDLSITSTEGNVSIDSQSTGSRIALNGDNLQVDR